MLLTLGFWQVSRYEHKSVLLAAYHHALESKPVMLLGLRPSQRYTYKHVKVSGVLLSKQSFIVNNRSHHHRPGIEVITALKMGNDQKWLLVNRGWRPLAKKNTPIDVVGKHALTGYLVYPEASFTLGSNWLNEGKGSPYQIQSATVKAMQKIIGHPVYPYVLKLDNSSLNQATGFIRDWQVVNMKPVRHLGYAVQWFLMALALVIAFVIFSTQEKTNK